jgi:uracil phosphoribosyltransferase
MCYEATRDLPTEEVEVETPICPCKSKVISGKKMALIPILRAGLGMVDGMLSMMPAVKVGHIGMYRDPETLLPVDYYCKLPPDISERDAMVLDPMLATGGTAAAAVTRLKNFHVRSVKFLCVLSAPEGIGVLQEAHPDVDIYTCCVDERLNDHAYIVPGLGDAGDRIFGTR